MRASTFPVAGSSRSTCAGMLHTAIHRASKPWSIAVQTGPPRGTDFSSAPVDGSSCCATSVPNVVHTWPSATCTQSASSTGRATPPTAVMSVGGTRLAVGLGVGAGVVTATLGAPSLLGRAAPTGQDGEQHRGHGPWGRCRATATEPGCRARTHPPIVLLRPSGRPWPDRVVRSAAR